MRIARANINLDYCYNSFLFECTWQKPFYLILHFFLASKGIRILKTLNDSTNCIFFSSKERNLQKINKMTWILIQWQCHFCAFLRVIFRLFRINKNTSCVQHNNITFIFCAEFLHFILLFEHVRTQSNIIKYFLFPSKCNFYASLKWKWHRKVWIDLILIVYLL